MSAAAIVVAGGAGSRMQARVNKVFIEIAGHSILDRSLELFESSSLVDDVVLVARQADLPTCESLRARFPKLSAIVAGGDVRHRSEFAGLRALAARQGFIATDTASVVEWAGGEVTVIEGEPDNLKITTPEDLARAERIAAGR